jgi:iron complex transport system ATP-binding protein
MTVVMASRLTVHLGGAPVLDNVDIAVDAGSLVCVVGPNGAGKTTLMHCFAGELDPTDGSTAVGGVDPSRATIAARARLRAFLAQEERPDIPYSVAEVVRFGTHLSSLDEDGQDAIVDAAMTRLEVDDLAERIVSSLSGGERRRVAIARTLAQGADVVMLDEPTESLDLGHANSVMRLLLEQTRMGCTVIATSHDLNLASRHADRVIVLDRGAIVADGDPASVLTAELLSGVYNCDVRVLPHPEHGRPVVFL